MEKKFSLILLALLILVPIYGESFSFLRTGNSVGKENPCSLPPDGGRCYGYFLKYFYNGTSRSCDTFIYGGCGGNENNFWTQRQCKDACEESSTRKKESNTLISFELNNPLKLRDDCDSPKDTGYCYASIRRFYFNGETCEAFTYGGCGGNGNNFRTKEQCMKKCGHKLDIGSGEAEEDNIFSIPYI